MLQPVVRRTWAPKGKTPIHYSWSRHERLSAISAVTLSPLGCRFGIYFQIHHQNIRFGEVVAFLKLLHRHLGRKFILVLDRYSVHRKALRLLKEEHHSWLDVEWLPPYAPELNPVEPLWNHSKYVDLANFIPAGIEDLYEAVDASISSTKSNSALVRSFFHYAKLKL